MKTAKIISLSFVFILFLSQFTFAQKSANATEVKFLTSATCGSCKTTIEKALKTEGGVSYSALNLTDKVVTVKYDASKTTPDKIKAAIVKSGYKAELVTSNSTSNGKSKEKCNDKTKCKTKCSGGKA